MQKTTQTLQESNPKAFAACLKSVCDAMTQGPNAIGIAQKYKGQLGCLLSNPVEQMVGAEFAPQVIGELVELPHH